MEELVMQVNNTYYVVKMELVQPSYITYHLDEVVFDTNNHRFVNVPKDEGPDIMRIIRMLVHEVLSRTDFCEIDLDETTCPELKDIVRAAVEYSFKAETHLA